MNVHLTPELERMVHSKVQTGRYNSASEVVREALRLMDDHDAFRALQRDDVRRKIEDGLSSISEGRVYDGDEVFAQLEAELDLLEQASHK
jgi:antitoxin ParD1/3/4